MGFDLVSFIISNRSLLDQVIDIVPIPLFMKDREGRYIDCNQAFTRFLSLPREEIIGKTVFELWKAEEAEVFHAQDQALYESGDQQVYESGITSSDGLRHSVQFHKQVVRDSGGEVKGFLGAIFDLTDQKEKEECIVQLLREKELVLREAHHHIKNNMASVMGLISLRIASGVPLEARAVLEEAKTQLCGMSILYEKLYQASSTEEVILGSYLRSLMSEARALLEIGKSVALRAEVPDIPVDPKVASDLGIVLNELFTNSCKYAFSETTAPRVELLGRVEGDCLVLDYCDNGRGMPEGFELSGSKGFGMGVIRGIMVVLEGRVSLEPSATGAHFRISLPLSSLR
jgi:PAS domain S-box-containing protein